MREIVHGTDGDNLNVQRNEHGHCWLVVEFEFCEFSELTGLTGARQKRTKVDGMPPVTTVFKKIFH